MPKKANGIARRNTMMPVMILWLLTYSNIGSASRSGRRARTLQYRRDRMRRLRFHRTRRVDGAKQKRRTCVRLFGILAEWTGLEPATPGVTGRYSNRLNYHS